MLKKFIPGRKFTMAGCTARKNITLRKEEIINESKCYRRAMLYVFTLRLSIRQLRSKDLVTKPTATGRAPQRQPSSEVSPTNQHRRPPQLRGSQQPTPRGLGHSFRFQSNGKQNSNCSYKAIFPMCFFLL